MKAWKKRLIQPCRGNRIVIKEGLIWKYHFKDRRIEFSFSFDPIRYALKNKRVITL